MSEQSNIWFSTDGRFSIRWDLVATTQFWPNTESNVSQRDHGKQAYPDKPAFYADKMQVTYQDALDAYAAYRAYHNLP